MNRANIIPRIQVDNYYCKLGSGTARINNRGLRWVYDAQIEIYTRIENTFVTVGFSNGNVVNMRHTDPATISMEARYYFVENIGQPYAQAFIGGRTGILPDVEEISIGFYIFRKSNEYERYIDLLRNEEPVYLEFYTEIDEDQSHYKIQPPDLGLLPIEQLQIRGLSTVLLRTFNEEVGEGE